MFMELREGGGELDMVRWKKGDRMKDEEERKSEVEGKAERKCICEGSRSCSFR